MAHRILFVILLVFAVAAPILAEPTRNNDDSCDIATLPAATLLLPYFEVDINNPNGETTLFTITNATAQEQIAHVTLWTDYAYPVIDFNVYLTGYDVQSINLYDIIVRGFIAPDLGTGTDVSEVGDYSVDNDRLDLTDCDELPGQIPAVYITRMLSAFTLGRIPAFGTLPECNKVGNTHEHAIGYATIDVVRKCTVRHPAMTGYLTEDILWDNVLMGDYQQVNRTTNQSEGGPMVHIRAVPEGGTAAERRNMPESYQISSHRTFYSRFLPSNMHTFDGRQPLPALFAARWIDGGPSSFNTTYKIWREGRTGADAPCVDYINNVAGAADVAIFDEEENGQGMRPDVVICTPIPFYPTLPATSPVRATDTAFFPRLDFPSVSGWMFMNLDNCTRDDFASQNWVIASMRAEGRFSVDLDAYSLGNGCSPPMSQSQVTNEGTGTPIGPAPNVNP